MADQDWFKFTTTLTNAAGNYVKINFLNSQGDVDLVLYDGKGILVGTSAGTGDEERISLEGMAASLYYVKISGLPGVRNPDVLLTVDPPSSGFDGIHTLYLNFDDARDLGGGPDALGRNAVGQGTGKTIWTRTTTACWSPPFQPENTNRETVIARS